MLHTTLIIHTTNKAAAPGIKDEKEFATAGGTESGRVIT